MADYKTFVAWRYLLVNPRRVSNRVVALYFAGLALSLIYFALFALDAAPSPLEASFWLQSGLLLVTAGTFVVWYLFILRHSKLSMGLSSAGFVVVLISLAFLYLAVPRMHLEPEQEQFYVRACGQVGLVGLGVALVFGYIGTIRAFFTFFTTVPIVGVFTGSMALVGVLSVMSGFETDLRTKILGSNAHIQVTREDGDFTEWRGVKKKIDDMPGVVASTPYAVSEVVIASNNNGMNVIIKGIDRRSVGQVTELVHDIESGTDEEKEEVMKRLDPLVDDPHDLRVPQKKPDAGSNKDNVVDPPPSDMPTSGDPIDYSGGQGSGSGTTANTAPAGIDPQTEPELFVDDLPPRDVVDPPPPDLLTTDQDPVDYSGMGSSMANPAIHVVDVPIESPAMTRRTQSLPGVLVGRELVKQTHLYTGEEVRVVSPLSDPSNPDATGTPIPFNRDYRVAGVFYTGMYEYDLKYVYVTLDSLEEFLDRGDAIDGIEIRVDDPDATDEYVAQLQDELGPQYRIQDWKELNRSLFSALKLEKIAMFLVLGIVIIVASFAIVGNLIMVVVEKEREIALLKTLGASDLGMLQLFAIQGLLIGTLATGLGIAVGLLACWFGQHFGIPLNPDVYYIDRMPVHVELQSIVFTALAGVLISILATLYPALRAARVRPAAGMRH